MSCPHSSQPGPCSSCMGASARIVTTSGKAVLVDGKIVRLGDVPQRRFYTAMPRRKERKK